MLATPPHHIPCLPPFAGGYNPQGGLSAVQADIMNFFNAPDAQGDAGISLDDVSWCWRWLLTATWFGSIRLETYSGTARCGRPAWQHDHAAALTGTACHFGTCAAALTALACHCLPPCRCWCARAGGTAWCRSGRRWTRCRTRATSTPPLTRTTSRWGWVEGRRLAWLRELAGGGATEGGGAERGSTPLPVLRL